MQTKHFTEGGTELSAQDIEDINRTTKRDTIRNVLAVVGMAGIAYFAYGVLKGRKISVTSND